MIGYLYGITSERKLVEELRMQSGVALVHGTGLRSQTVFDVVEPVSELCLCEQNLLSRSNSMLALPLLREHIHRNHDGKWYPRGPSSLHNHGQLMRRNG
jgi:hypothetical protein